jgi:hypothetical protein
MPIRARGRSAERRAAGLGQVGFFLIVDDD